LSSGFLDILPGESIAIAADEAPSVDLMYRPGEPIFGAVARDLVANGWSVFPQDDERRPGVVNNQAIAWVKEHKLPTQLPRPEALDLWIRALPTHNVAVALGPGSGHAFAIDIDITDHDLSNRVAALAEEMLGATPLVRIGKAPKIALIYRYDPADPLQNISRKLSETDENGKIVASEHAIEILTQGKPITLLGKHHTTGRYFRWLYQSPMEIGPEAAPLVSSERMAAFLEAIDENIRRFHRSSNMFVQPEEVTWDEKAKTYIPRLTTVAGGSAWSENEDGLIEDGREAYLTSLVHSFVRTNPGMPGDQIKANVFDLFSNSVVMEGRWSPNSAQREVNSKVDSLLSKISGGEYHMRYRTVEPSEEKVVFTDGKFKLPYSRIDLEKRGLGFLPDSFKRCTIPGRIVDQGEPYVLTDEQRQKDIDNIGTGLTNALDEFFEDMFAVNCGRNPQESVVHVIKAPTGAGKTSRTIAYIGAKKDEHRARANRPRMEGRRDEDGRVVVPAQGLDLFYEDENGNEHPGSMPIVFLLPTYANIEEVRIRAETLNLDPTLSDEDLKDSARERGLVPEEELESRLEDMRRDAMNAGLTTLVYKGKIAAGCQMADKVKAAMEAGIGSSAFCKADVKRDNGESETVFCPHYIGCPAISQKELIQQADLVFTPHPFMQLNIPRELSAARAVIADERIHHLFLHTAEFPAEHLTLPRKPVRLKAEERDRGDMEEDFVLARNAAVDIAYDAMLADKCPAKALYEHEEVMPDGTVMRNGPDLVEKCLRICSNALRKDVALNPELDLEQVIELCSQPTGIHVREEHRFWKIIHERIQMLTRQNLEIAGGRQAEINAIEDPDERQAHQDLYDMELERLREFPLPKGEKDLRIQLVKDDLPSGHVRRSIRISWRTVPNWADVPLLLLDASAAPEIIHKIWGGTRVRSHDISGPLHMRVVGVVNRTFSNASVVGDPKATDSHKLVTARNLAQLRNAISAVSSWFGHSRVVCGSSILVRRIINTDWKGPENVDWCHFGAMRGLDFAKYHAAALSIGRMELPVRTIDGLVAALTYDDDEPELPFDVDGTGKKKVGNAYLPLLMPSEPQKLRMRSGELVEIPTPMHPGKWGRLIQRQYREEELLQFCGRLRPVYREGEAPIWFALSSVIPENLIIDDLVHIDDLVRMRERAWFWDAARRTHGILHPDVLAETCPEFFADRSEAKTVMNLQGFSYETGETTKSTSQGYTPYRIVSDRADAYAFVLTELDDRRERLEAALRKHGITFSAIELAIDGAEPRSIARARVADTIDVELGQLEDREADELVNAERANVRLFSMGVKRMDELMPNLPSHPLTYAISSAASNENQRIRFYDAEAQETLDSIWEKMLYDQAVRQNAVMQDNGETYDRLGDHIGDNDSGN
jgi:hypothetical protein